MKSGSTILMIAVFVLAWGQISHADSVERYPASEFNTANIVELEDIARIDAPDSFIILDAEGTQELMEYTGNTYDDSHIAAFIPESGEWFAIISWLPVGHIEDDEAQDLDTDELIAQMRTNTEMDNRVRQKQGLPQLGPPDWHQVPLYYPEKHAVEWATEFSTFDPDFLEEPEPTVNYRSLLLGRKGFLMVTWVGGPEQMAYAIPDFKGMVNTIFYKAGQGYEDYSHGDKIADFGLKALMIGGGAAVLSSPGGGIAKLFKRIWKLLVIGAIAVATFFKKLFRRPAKPAVATSGSRGVLVLEDDEEKRGP